MNTKSISPLSIFEKGVLKCLCLTLVIILWTGCYNTPNGDLQTQEAKHETSSTKVTNHSVSSEEGELKQSEENQSKFPSWLQKVNQRINDKQGQRAHSEVNSFHVLNDSLSYAVFEFSNGVCQIQNLETFLNERSIDKLEIQNICDHDQSNPVYKWKDYELINSNTIKLLKFYKYSDSSKTEDNESLKSTLDFLEVSVKIDTIITHHRIKPDGSISIAL